MAILGRPRLVVAFDFMDIFNAFLVYAILDAHGAQGKFYISTESLTFISK
jgi:hypothetical protein